MKQRNVKSGFITLLHKFNSKKFTVDDLTEAYLQDSSNTHTSKKAARQFVYRNMLKLIKNGDLERLIVDQGWPLYALTSQFYVNADLPEAPIAANNDCSRFTVDPVQSLRERLIHCKLDMLSAIGETEEYNAICSEIPELRNEVQILYNESRDRCSKLLGRVKALESLIAAPR